VNQKRHIEKIFMIFLAKKRYLCAKVNEFKTIENGLRKAITMQSKPESVVSILFSGSCKSSLARKQPVLHNAKECQNNSPKNLSLLFHHSIVNLVANSSFHFSIISPCCLAIR
jgi:hypothetical protein